MDQDDREGDESPDFKLILFAVGLVVVATLVSDPFLGPALWYLGLTLFALVSIRTAWAWLRTQL